MSALGPIEILFLLAPVIAVPLALRLTAAPAEATPALWAARRLQPYPTGPPPTLPMRSANRR